MTRTILGICALALAALALTAGGASADVTVCEAGPAAGDCSDPRGVAADLETKRVYVADRGGDEIDVFEVDEGEGKVEYLFSCGGLEAPRRVAVDNDPLSATRHEVYVYDATPRRVKRFEPDCTPVGESAPFNNTSNPITTGPGGTVYVGDTMGEESTGFEPRVVQLNPKLEPIGECDLSGTFRVDALTVDGAGEIYVMRSNDLDIFKFAWAEPECTEAGAPFPLSFAGITTALATDPDDNLFAAQAAGGRVVTEIEASGQIARRYGYGSATSTVPGIAPLPTSLGDAFIAQEAFGGPGHVKYLTEPPSGPLLARLAAVAGNVRANLEAEVNPEGEDTQVHFEYLTEPNTKRTGKASPGRKRRWRKSRSPKTRKKASSCTWRRRRSAAPTRSPKKATPAKPRSKPASASSPKPPTATGSPTRTPPGPVTAPARDPSPPSRRWAGRFAR